MFLTFHFRCNHDVSQVQLGYVNWCQSHFDHMYNAFEIDTIVVVLSFLGSE